MITKEEFLALDPSDIEVFVVKPVKKIVALLSHVVRILSNDNRNRNTCLN